MLLVGILFGPHMFDFIAPEILVFSAELRQLALIIILLRAGFSFDITDLRKIGRPAILMAFIPAAIEIVAVTIFAPMFFSVTRLEAAIMGAILAAVSPAVVVPRMLQFIKSGHGQANRVPQLVMAGASVNGIFVLVVFSSFMGMASDGYFNAMGFIRMPVAIVLGVLVGILVGVISRQGILREKM